MTPQAEEKALKMIQGWDFIWGPFLQPNLLGIPDRVSFILGEPDGHRLAFVSQEIFENRLGRLLDVGLIFRRGEQRGF